MQLAANLEQAILENVRQLPPDKQQEVLEFAEFLRRSLPSPSPTAKPSLQHLASLPVSQRHQLLEPFIADMAEDFKNDPELTEFSALDDEDWEHLHDEP